MSVVDLNARRPSLVGAYEFTCGICGVVTCGIVRLDAFPSCMACRWRCMATRKLDRTPGWFGAQETTGEGA